MRFLHRHHHPRPAGRLRRVSIDNRLALACREELAVIADYRASSGAITP